MSRWLQVWPSKSCFRVNFRAFFYKLVGFLFQTDLESLFFGNFLFSSLFANVLCDFDEFRLPANLALRVTFNVIYPSAPA
jgi:hypothetical protein